MTVCPKCDEPIIIGIAVVFFIIIVLWLPYLSEPQGQPSKKDGWVYFSGGERYVGHDNAIGLCRLDDDCREMFMGCGAVNCRCANKTEADIEWFFNNAGCSFVQGEGVVCSRK